MSQFTHRIEVKRLHDHDDLFQPVERVSLHTQPFAVVHKLEMLQRQYKDTGYVARLVPYAEGPIAGDIYFGNLPVTPKNLR